VQAAVKQPQWAPDRARVLNERQHHHDHDYHHDDCANDEQALCRSVTGEVITLRYDHFGDFTGFVVQTQHDGRVEALACDA
jgi:hypothetical protein